MKQPSWPDNFEDGDETDRARIMAWLDHGSTDVVVRLVPLSAKDRAEINDPVILQMILDAQRDNALASKGSRWVLCAQLKNAIRLRSLVDANIKGRRFTLYSKLITGFGRHTSFELVQLAYFIPRIIQAIETDVANHRKRGIPYTYPTWRECYATHVTQPRNLARLIVKQKPNTKLDHLPVQDRLTTALQEAQLQIASLMIENGNLRREIARMRSRSRLSETVP